MAVFKQATILPTCPFLKTRRFIPVKLFYRIIRTSSSCPNEGTASRYNSLMWVTVEEYSASNSAAVVLKLDTTDFVMLSS